MRLQDLVRNNRGGPRKARPETTARSRSNFGNDTSGIAPLAPVVTKGPIILIKPGEMKAVDMGGGYTAMLPDPPQIVILP